MFGGDHALHLVSSDRAKLVFERLKLVDALLQVVVRQLQNLKDTRKYFKSYYGRKQILTRLDVGLGSHAGQVVRTVQHWQISEIVARPQLRHDQFTRVRQVLTVASAKYF